MNLHVSSRRAGRAGLISAAVLAAVVVSSCATSSSLVNLWKDPQYPKQPWRDVPVVAMKKDPVMRRVWEDGVARQLARRGVEATPSYRQFPDAVPDTQQVVSAVKSHRYDGVLVAHGLHPRTDTRYVSGYVDLQPEDLYDPWTGIYSTYYRDVYHPGYTETEKIVRYRVQVWSTEGQGRLVWPGTTETIDPTSKQDVNRQVSRPIAPELARSGVIAKNRT